MKKSTFLFSFAIIGIVFNFLPAAKAAQITTGFYGLTVWGDFAQALSIARDNGFRIAVVGADSGLLDMIQAHDMRAIVAFWMNREMANHPKKWNEFKEYLRLKISELKKHPAVFAWYIVDEPDGKRIPVKKIEEAHSIVRSLDRRTPLFTVLNSPRFWRYYLPFFDIVAVDPYLRRNLIGYFDSPDVVRDWIAKIKADLKKAHLSKPVWAVLGVFDARPRNRAERSNYKKPSPMEIRQMVDLAVAEGVEGILFYTFAFKESDRFFGWKLIENDPQLWEEVKSTPSRLSGK